MALVTESTKAETYPLKQSPPVSVLDAATATAEEVVAALKIAGACIIRNAVSVEVVDQIE